MIVLKSLTSDGSSYDVFEDENLIGHVRLKESLSGNRYLALIYQEGEEKSAGEEFISPQDALQWIERMRMEGSRQ